MGPHSTGCLPCWQPPQPLNWLAPVPGLWAVVDPVTGLCLEQCPIRQSPAQITRDKYCQCPRSMPRSLVGYFGNMDAGHALSPSHEGSGMEPSITSPSTCLHFSPSHSRVPRGLWRCRDSSATQDPHCRQPYLSGFHVLWCPGALAPAPSCHTQAEKVNESWLSYGAQLWTWQRVLQAGAAPFSALLSASLMPLVRKG